jgi:hypothetical protein
MTTALFEHLTSLDNIPKVMRKKGWRLGAQLMETWFSRPLAIAPAYSRPVTDVIKMEDWALGFPRANKVWHSILEEKAWTENYARTEIGGMLLRNGYLIGKYPAKPFGDLSQPAVEVHKNHINYFNVGYGMTREPKGRIPNDSWFIVDDLTAALGRFAFWMAVAGTIEPIQPNFSYRATIQEIGVYIKDSYDFEGYQYLGSWSDDDFSLMGNDDTDGIYNETFRGFRERSGKGGDFLVFSDVIRMPLDSSYFPPYSLTVYYNGAVE